MHLEEDITLVFPPTVEEHEEREYERGNGDDNGNSGGQFTYSI